MTSHILAQQIQAGFKSNHPTLCETFEESDGLRVRRKYRSSKELGCEKNTYGASSTGIIDVQSERAGGIMSALPIVEAAYQLYDSDKLFFSELCDAATACFRRSRTVAAFSYSSDKLMNLETCAIQGGDGSFADSISAMSISMSDDAYAAMYFGSPDLIDPMENSTNDQAKLAISLNVHETMGLLGSTGGTSAIGIAFTVVDRDAWSSEYRSYLAGVAHHLAAAWRLRASLRQEAAIKAAEFAPSGRELDAQGPASSAPLRAALREAVRRREAVRAKRKLSADGELWPSLIAGRWTIIDEYEASGSRRVVAYENASSARYVRALSERETEVLRHVAAGRSGKWIAAELQVSQPSVSRCLRRALQCLGIRQFATLSAMLGSTKHESISLDGHNIAKPFSAVSHRGVVDTWESVKAKYVQLFMATNL